MDTAALFEALSPLDRQKGLAALEQVRVERVTDADGPLFDAAYRLLDGFFGPRGELEAREVLAGFVRQPVLDFGGGLLGVYHLVALRAGRRHRRGPPPDPGRPARRDLTRARTSPRRALGG